MNEAKVEWRVLSEDYDGLSDDSSLEVLPGGRVRATCNSYSKEYALAGPPTGCDSLDDEEYPVCAEDPHEVDRLCRKAFGVGLAPDEVAG